MRSTVCTTSVCLPAEGKAEGEDLLEKVQLIKVPQKQKRSRGKAHLCKILSITILRGDGKSRQGF